MQAHTSTNSRLGIASRRCDMTPTWVGRDRLVRAQTERLRPIHHWPWPIDSDIVATTPPLVTKMRFAEFEALSVYSEHGDWLACDSQLVFRNLEIRSGHDLQNSHSDRHMSARRVSASERPGAARSARAPTHGPDETYRHRYASRCRPRPPRIVRRWWSVFRPHRGRAVSRCRSPDAGHPPVIGCHGTRVNTGRSTGATRGQERGPQAGACSGTRTAGVGVERERDPARQRLHLRREHRLASDGARREHPCPRDRRSARGDQVPQAMPGRQAGLVPVSPVIWSADISNRYNGWPP